MDFFEHQHVARRKTGRLVVLMALAVFCIAALIYGLVVVCAVWIAGQRAPTPGPYGLYSPSVPDVRYLELLGYTLAGVGAVVVGGSLYKIRQLAAGGRAVAESLGGRPVAPDTTDPDERRLLNVVEEMAIASGSPVPPVYLLDDEGGINAFAAGWSIEDAVIGVTRGGVRQLSRDELQGVIAHEFSHILYGDMRINLRLTGLIYGIMVIAVVGSAVMRSVMHSGHAGRRSGGKKDARAVIAIFLFGAALMAIGYLGVFFGRLIQAAVSRQREFLADASAVQFTRNPDGIAGALRRIGGWSDGSRLGTAHATEHAHMFFGSVAAGLLSRALATHPPLPQRITRIDPGWEGKYLGPRRTSRSQDPRVAGFAGGADVPAPQAEWGDDPEAVARTAFEQIGRPTPAHLQHAHGLIASIPAVLHTAAHTTTGAQAVVLALLLDRKSVAVRQVQLEQLTAEKIGPVGALTHRLADDAAGLDAGLRLPLVELSLPALARLNPQELDGWQVHVDQMIAADDRLDLFEWALRQMVWRHLRPPAEADTPGRRSGRLKLLRCRDEVTLLLSALSQVGARRAAAAGRAFAAAAERVALPKLEMLPGERLSIGRLTDAVDRLAELDSGGKRQLIAACAAAVQADGETTPREMELFRAVADTLGVPVPPVLRGQALI